VKLTLIAEETIVELTKRLVAENGTSASGLFSRVITATGRTP